MKALVTGGGGFLGKAVVRLLVEKGHEVRSYSRGDYPELREIGAEHVAGDLADKGSLAGAMAGCDTVFHVAAKAGIWGRRREFHEANVTGTRNVLEACRELAVAKLVYTSTPSVVYAGKGIEGGDESLPYPDRFEAHYPATKATAEKMVLQADSPSLCTVALRPHLIWGPGDRHFLPRLVARARAGQLRLIGGREVLVDCVYIDNAAFAHLQAAEKLRPGSAVAGKVYFITQGEPIPIAELMNKILKAAGAPPVSKIVPAQLAYAAGAVLEAVYGLLRIEREPKMTRFLARQLSTPHWFDIKAARRDLGYEPVVSIEEGMARLAAWADATRHG